MPKFQISSPYQPTGDQPEAIAQLSDGIARGDLFQTLLGVTGSGKTFTIANVIQNVGKPTLILSHNKTLAAQLYEEFKSFFPHNAVEYYVSYYDYYQPEAYIASTDTYIEKDLSINAEIDKLRLAATSALLSGRKDVIVVSSISCIYGMGNPAAFYENVIALRRGMQMDRNELLRKLVSSLYVRNDIEPHSGNFTIKGDSVFVHLAYSNEIIRISFWDDEIDAIDQIDANTHYKEVSFEQYKIYPANLFVTSQETTQQAIAAIQDDLMEQEQMFREIGKTIEANRIHERVTYDLEMIKELGHCSGIENYSRYFDGRAPGTRPYCLLDFFPEDFLLVIDESHESVPQLRAMYGGDRARKLSLVEYGFRLPAAFDNRPLKEDEFWSMVKQTIFVSATPAEFELEKCEGVVVEQIIRPTSLLDPEISIRPTMNQIDDLIEEIHQCIERDERVLVTTLTKRNAEDLTDYLYAQGIHCNYIHSDVGTMERIEIINQLRAGIIQVLIGVNLLREGLDLPEVSLVAILDADKEGFLRSHRSLTQTAGRAARNVHGHVIMYADHITGSMQQTIDETSRRRTRQIAYNDAHHLAPQQIRKGIRSGLMGTTTEYSEGTVCHQVAENSPEDNYKFASNRSKISGENSASHPSRETVESLKKKMEAAAKQFDFVLAAQYRDEMLSLMNEKAEKPHHS